LIFKNGSFKSRLRENHLIGKYFYDPFLGEMDNIGLIIRTAHGLYVSYIHKGKIELIRYSDFLANKNNNYVKIRFKDKLNKVDDTIIQDMKKRNSIFFDKLKK
jgi:hypothetical protein